MRLLFIQSHASVELQWAVLLNQWLIVLVFRFTYPVIVFLLFVLSIRLLAFAFGIWLTAWTLLRFTISTEFTVFFVAWLAILTTFVTVLRTTTSLLKITRVTTTS